MLQAKFDVVARRKIRPVEGSSTYGHNTQLRPRSVMDFKMRGAAASPDLDDKALGSRLVAMYNN